MTKSLKTRLVFYGIIVGILLYSHRPHCEVAPELKRSRDEFLKIIAPYCPNLKLPARDDVRFSNLQRPTIGYCRRGFNWTEIVIDKSAWEMMDEKTRDQLIDHEASHCYLKTEHSDDPSNYMYGELTRLENERLVEQQIIENAKVACNGL